jgi:acyl-CoA synthetase (NDP forming)
MLEPRSVAVVGAGRRHGGTGHEVLRAIRDYGFRGRLFAVNQSGRPVCDVPAYRALTDLPSPSDLLVLAVPPDDLPNALTGAGRSGAGGAVLLGDPLTQQHRRAVLMAARAQGIRLLGPSSLGVLNADPAVRLNASLSPARPPSGGLALAVRSGAVGIGLLQQAVQDHCGVSSVVSLGEGLDVSAADVLDYWSDDPATRAIAVALESIDDPIGFARHVRVLSRRKPVIAMASGLHDPIEELALAQAGVIRTTGLCQTVDAARMLVDQPLPAGRRMVIAGNAGGLTALAAGSARAHHFDLVRLSSSTRAQLPALGSSAPHGNPVDLDIDVSSARLANVIETVAHSDEADVLLLILVGNRSNLLAAKVSAVTAALDGQPRLTVAAVVIGSTGRPHRLGHRGVPVFSEPERAVRALAQARDYAGWRREPPVLDSGYGRIRELHAVPGPIAFLARDADLRLAGRGASPAPAPGRDSLGPDDRAFRAPVERDQQPH